MNDLFSSSFKKYTDLKQQAQMDDIESGKETMNLDKFFEDVENVKDDMKGVETLYKSLQDSNEECKTVHNAKKVKELRAKMDGDVAQVLKRVKMIKQKLEALEKANANSRNVSGCGPGSSTDRTRTSVVSGLGKKLKDLMDSFQGLRARMNAEYKETVERRYFTITGEQADEQTIENLISSGESENFLQKAIQEQGRGQILDTISEIPETRRGKRDREESYRASPSVLRHGGSGGISRSATK
ncbi:Syntaxin N-terminal domain [Arabidopsis thaliana x Arabidopsis arenosa]|uniref:SYP124 n=2 Tax=Arabidopsis TaxID=3701 RepID=A0A178W2T4_ARATH|nr:Syntaxin N-terminal domain [Arabidopsis thaliana x Arabidopsis arenosa]OAP12767.1 SYP124 [Arabidopsis thaliana]